MGRVLEAAGAAIHVVQQVPSLIHVPDCSTAGSRVCCYVHHPLGTHGPRVTSRKGRHLHSVTGPHCDPCP